MGGLKQLFVTSIYSGTLPGARALNRDLEAACLSIAAEDKAGRAWAKAHRYKGYTSYGALDDLVTRAPAFADLARALEAPVRGFARAVAFDMRGRRLKLDSLWLNVLKTGGVHAPHIHPHAVISGTYYVSVPQGSGDIRFEDPRLGLMMAAPPRRPKAAEHNRSFVTVPPKPGMLLLWESWLRHGVEEHRAKAPRISISFNYRLD